MKRLLVLVFCLFAAADIFGSAASTFTTTTTKSVATNTAPAESPSAIALPASVVEPPSTNVPIMTVSWNPVLYTNTWSTPGTNFMIPVTYDVGARTNKDYWLITTNVTTNICVLTNYPTETPTEYSVRAVGSNGMMSVWAKGVFMPPPPVTNSYEFRLMSRATSTNSWLTNSVLLAWTNPPANPPGNAQFWNIVTNRVTTTIRELNLMSSTNIPTWAKVKTLQRWTNSAPAKQWKLEYSVTPIK